MIKIKYKLKSSKIHGIGLFADEDIEMNQVVFESSKQFMSVWTTEKFTKLNSCTKKYIKHYGSFSNIDNLWHLNHDDIRFCNHSIQKNNISRKDLSDKNYQLVAMRGIKKGEELLQDYNEFDDTLKKRVDIKR